MGGNASRGFLVGNSLTSSRGAILSKSQNGLRVFGVNFEEGWVHVLVQTLLDKAGGLGNCMRIVNIKWKGYMCILHVGTDLGRAVTRSFALK